MDFKKARKTEETNIYPLFVCPICKEKYPDNSIRMHIFHRAKTEVWQKAIGIIKEVPHFNFYKKNTDSSVASNRHWKI